MNPSKTLLRASLMITFARIVESGSISAAARNMKLNKAAVSRQLKSLEDQLNVKLLNRSTRESGVTDVGRIVYARAAQVVHEVENAQREAELFRSTESGVLTVSASVAFGKMQVIPLLASFLDKHPKIDVELCLLDRHVDPVEEKFDVLFRLCDEPPPHLVAHRLASIEYVVVVATSTTQKSSRIKDPRELAGQHCLFYGFKNRKVTWRFLRDRIVYDVDVATRVSVNSSQAVRYLALKGLGIALLPRYIVESDLQSGRLQEILTDYTVEGHQGHSVYAIHLPGRIVPQKVNAFVAYFRSSWESSSGVCRGPRQIIQK